MSEFALLSEHGAISSHGSVPTPVAVPNRGHPRREGTQTRTDAKSVSTTLRGNGAIIRASLVTCPTRKPLSAAQSVAPTPETEDPGNHCRYPYRTSRTSACPLHHRGFTLDRP